MKTLAKLLDEASRTRTVKEYTTTGTGTEGSLLIEKTIYATLWDAAQKTLIPRDIIAVQNGPGDIKGSSIDIDLVDPDSMRVYELAEGQAIPIDVLSYTSINLKPVRYGVRIPVTKEMVEDGKWNLIQKNVEYAGREIAENENSLILQALDNAGTTISGGARVLYSDLTNAIKTLRDNDYNPDTLICGHEFMDDLLNIDVLVRANERGNKEALDTGMINNVLGMKVVLYSTNAAPSSTYSKYGYVIDSQHALTMAEKRPITVEKYDDKIHDLSGAVVTQRIKYSYLRADAIVKITTS